MSRKTLVYESRKFTVERWPTTNNDGQSTAYDIIVHPGAAVVLPLLPDGKVVMIHNFRLAVGDELLELPAGTLDLPEPPSACALRELTEETGYTAGRLRPLGEFYTTPGFCTERMYAFLATNLKAGAAAPEASEKIRVVTLSYDAALKGIRTGRIADAKSIAALLLYDRFYRREPARPRTRAPQRMPKPAGAKRR